MKRYNWLRRPFIFLYDFLRALRHLKIDASSLREFLATQRGFVGLGPGNYRLYANLFPRLLAGQTAERPVIILDVGASDGWFAKIVFRFCDPATHVISFEPLRSIAAKLSFLSGRYPNYRYENVAVGAVAAEKEITEYGTPELSSFKELAKDYAYSAFDTTIIDKYPVKVITIDEYLTDRQLINDIILKIDTQGFEYEVLTGAVQALTSGQIKAVIIEAMTREKYAGARLYDELFNFLHAKGFKLFDVYPFYYESDGSLSEFDCVFVRR